MATAISIEPEKMYPLLFDEKGNTKLTSTVSIIFEYSNGARFPATNGKSLITFLITGSKAKSEKGP